MLFTVRPDGEKGPAMTVMPRAWAEKIVAFFDKHPERMECKTGLPNGAVMVIKREDLPKLRAAVPIEKLNEVDIDGEGNIKTKPETKPVSKQDSQPGIGVDSAN